MHFDRQRGLIEVEVGGHSRAHLLSRQAAVEQRVRLHRATQLSHREEHANPLQGHVYHFHTWLGLELRLSLRLGLGLGFGLGHTWVLELRYLIREIARAQWAGEYRGEGAPTIALQRAAECAAAT